MAYLDPRSMISAMERITLRDDEYLVFQVPLHASWHDIQRLREEFVRVFGRDNAQRILVLTDKVTISSVKMPNLVDKYLLGEESKDVQDKSESAETV